MKLFIQRQLGEIGLEFVRAQLSDAGPLANGLLKNLEQGFVWEFVPAHATAILTPNQLNEGGRYDAAEAASLTSAYVVFLREFLLRNSSRVLLFENRHFKADDLLMPDKQNFYMWEGVMYFYFLGKGAHVSDSAVEVALPQASHHPYVVLATRRTFDEPFPTHGSLSREHAMALAEQVRHVLVGAYDGEGYVMWSRNLR
jgi:hypothetical protein